MGLTRALMSSGVPLSPTHSNGRDPAPVRKPAWIRAWSRMYGNGLLSVHCEMGAKLEDHSDRSGALPLSAVSDASFEKKGGGAAPLVRPPPRGARPPPVKSRRLSPDAVKLAFPPLETRRVTVGRVAKAGRHGIEQRPEPFYEVLPRALKRSRTRFRSLGSSTR